MADRPAPPLDLSHHFSCATRSREQSSVKKFYKYFQIPGIHNLAGGELETDPLLRPRRSCQLNAASPRPPPRVVFPI